MKNSCVQFPLRQLNKRYFIANILLTFNIWEIYIVGDDVILNGQPVGTFIGPPANFSIDYYPEVNQLSMDINGNLHVYFNELADSSITHE